MRIVLATEGPRGGRAGRPAAGRRRDRLRRCSPRPSSGAGIRSNFAPGPRRPRPATGCAGRHSARAARRPTSPSPTACRGCSAACRAGGGVLWLHNPGNYLRKPRHLIPLLAAWPKLVTLGASHSASLPAWLPLRPVEIPLALGAALRRARPRRARHHRPSPSSPPTRCAASTGCSTFGRSGSARRCRWRSCTSTPARPPMAAMRAWPPARHRCLPGPPPWPARACASSIPCRGRNWRRGSARPA